MKFLKELNTNQGLRKKILKFGDSLGYTFNTNECKTYGIELGKIMNLNDAFIEQDEKQNEKINNN